MIPIPVETAVFQSWIAFSAVIHLLSILFAWFFIDRSLGGVFIGLVGSTIIQFFIYELLLGFMQTVI